MISRSRRDSVGGGSSTIFPPSPRADAIQRGGGGGSSRIFSVISPRACIRGSVGGGSGRIFP